MRFGECTRDGGMGLVAPGASWNWTTRCPPAPPSSFSPLSSTHPPTFPSFLPTPAMAAPADARASPRASRALLTDPAQTCPKPASAILAKANEYNTPCRYRHRYSTDPGALWHARPRAVPVAWDRRRVWRRTSGSGRDRVLQPAARTPQGSALQIKPASPSHSIPILIPSHSLLPTLLLHNSPPPTFLRYVRLCLPRPLGPRQCPHNAHSCEFACVSREGREMRLSNVMERSGVRWGLKVGGGRNGGRRRHATCSGERRRSGPATPLRNRGLTRSDQVDGPSPIWGPLSPRHAPQACLRRPR